MLQPVAHAHRVGREITHAAQVEPVVFVGKILARSAGGEHQRLQMAHLVHEILLAVTGRHRNQHGHRHARNGRVDARIVEQPPHHHGRHQIEEHALLAHLLHEVDAEHDDQRRQQTSDLHLPAVEERDDQNGSEVVGDSQRREEYLERHGDPVAEHREDADGEGDVGGGRNTPAVGGHRTVVEGGEDDRREEHAARRGQHREEGLFGRRKLSADDLAFYLKPHGEEKNHHQAVVDQFLDGHPAREHPIDQPVGAMHHQREVGLQQMTVIERSRRQIGQQHGDDHASEQHDAPGPRGLHEITAAYTDHVALAHPAVHRK